MAKAHNQATIVITNSIIHVIIVVVVTAYMRISNQHTHKTVPDQIQRATVIHTNSKEHIIMLTTVVYG